MNSTPHHSFDIALATELGDISLAILVHHFQHWVLVNKRQGIHFIEGRTWTYQTMKYVAAHFPYWSKKQVERLLIKAVEKNILLTGNFNKNKFDRTVWYSFVDEEAFGISNFKETEVDGEIDIPKSGNGDPLIGTPIPDTKPDAKANKKEIYKKKKLERLTPTHFLRLQAIF